MRYVWKKIATPKLKNVRNIFVMGLFSIVFHYTSTYIGLSTTDSSKTAFIKQLGVLLCICFAFLFFKSEKFSLLKMFIIKFAEPLFACVFGAALLGENIFKIQYLAAFILIAAEIILGNRSETGK